MLLAHLLIPALARAGLRSFSLSPLANDGTLPFADLLLLQLELLCRAQFSLSLLPALCLCGGDGGPSHACDALLLLGRQPCLRLCSIGTQSLSLNPVCCLRLAVKSGEPLLFFLLSLVHEPLDEICLIGGSLLACLLLRTHGGWEHDLFINSWDEAPYFCQELRLSCRPRTCHTTSNRIQFSAALNGKLDGSHRP